MTTEPMTAHGWQEDEKGLLEDVGDVGGDAQIGPAYSRRFWATDTPTDLFELVEVNSYAASREGDEAGPLIVQLQWYYGVCADRADPGGTEQWADYLYEDIPVGSGVTADQLAREKVSQFVVEDFAAKAEEICRRAAMSRPAAVEHSRWTDAVGRAIIESADPGATSTGWPA